MKAKKRMSEKQLIIFNKHPKSVRLWPNWEVKGRETHSGGEELDWPNKEEVILVSND